MACPDFTWAVDQMTQPLKQVTGRKQMREYSLRGVSKPDSSYPSAFAELLSFCSVQAWNAIKEMQENLLLELKQRT